MAASDYPSCLAFVLEREGGYVDDPLDPGGATNLGITLATLGAWRHTAVTKDDVKNLTTADADAIYRANYWNAVHADNLPAGVDLMVFDCAVNTGNGRSARMLQAAVGATQDGAIGPATLAAVNAKDPKALIADLAARRIAFYQSLSTFDHFGKGWVARTNAAKALALQLAGG